MGAVTDALRALRDRVRARSSTRQKLLRPSVGDNSASGGRIIPVPTHARSVGVRIDRGVQVGDRIKVYARPNKQADNRTLRDLANENSHQNLAEAWIDTNDPIDNSTVDKVFDSLEASAKQNGH